MLAHVCPIAIGERSAAQALMLRIQAAGRLKFAVTQAPLQCGATHGFLESPSWRPQ